MVLWSVVFIMVAFVCYTLAVWAERFAGRLERWHLAVFWVGFVADATGTGMMSRIASAMGTTRAFVSVVHGATGLIALVLMLVHCLWATGVLVQRDEQAIRNFHRFSTAVWAVWMIPFLIGAGMQGVR